MSRIHTLPPELIGKIAAGEVVERPASIVKELVENSLDAGADEIRVQLAVGGTAMIRVADDGRGMSAEDAQRAFERHATSKIRSFEDLERVATLGFRGEGLASIAAVARVDLTTAEEDGFGTRVQIEGGTIERVEAISRPKGTTIEVADLFYNVPARRAFLKTPATELRHATAVLQAYALTRPLTYVRAEHEERQLIDAPPTSSDRQGALRRIGQIFGRSLAERLIEIDSVDGEARVWGFLGDPTTSKGRRQFIFVNGRSIRDRAVLAIFYRAVRDVWRKENFPALFLFLDLPPEEVDVNVHPQKAEVRFRDRQLLGTIGRALRKALEEGLGEISGGLGEVVEGAPLPRPAWSGLGGETVGASGSYSGGAGAPGAGEGVYSPAGRGSWEVREPRVAEAVYAPLPPVNIPLSGRTKPRESLRLLGQYKGTLLLLEGPDALYVIDQHVAHERILYERFRTAMLAETPPVQRLIEPRLLELAADEALRLGEIAERLATCGFELEVLSGATLALKGSPAPLSETQADRVLNALAAERGVASLSVEELRTRALDHLVADQACKAAVKMHEPMSSEAMQSLVQELFESEQPYVCPHGRPVVLKMTDVDLEKRFGRR